MVVHWRMPPHAQRTPYGNRYYTGERLPDLVPPEGDSEIEDQT